MAWNSLRLALQMCSHACHGSVSVHQGLGVTVSPLQCKVYVEHAAGVAAQVES